MKSKIKKIVMNEKGITLVVLIVTIIVLIIIAGVSLSMTLGKRGIISNANESKSEAERSSIESQIDMSILTVKQKNKTVTLDKIKKQLIIDKVITNQNQVGEDGTITTNSGEVFKEKLKDYTK